MTSVPTATPTIDAANEATPELIALVRTLVGIGQDRARDKTRRLAPKGMRALRQMTRVLARWDRAARRQPVKDSAAPLVKVPAPRPRGRRRRRAAKRAADPPAGSGDDAPPETTNRPPWQATGPPRTIRKEVTEVSFTVSVVLTPPCEMPRY
jgi:hypothetical protein